MRPIRQLYNLFLSSDKSFVRSLVSILGFIPVHVAFYKEAFMHRSNSDNKEPLNNERLEFLGDAILGAVMAEYLYNKYPREDEGFLTMMRSKVVNRKALNELANQMEFDVFLRQNGVEHISDSMLGNAFEAFIGAIYLDLGYRRTRKFVIRKILRNYVDVKQLENVNENYKSQLLEYCQREHKSLEYNLVRKFKQHTRDKFEVAVVINGEEVSTGEDFNKKSAEQIASKRAMERMGILQVAEG